MYYRNDIGQHLHSTHFMPTAEHCSKNVTYTNYSSQPRRSVLILFPLYLRLSTERLSNLPRITRLISSRAKQSSSTQFMLLTIIPYKYYTFFGGNWLCNLGDFISVIFMGQKQSFCLIFPVCVCMCVCVCEFYNIMVLGYIESVQSQKGCQPS